MTPAYAISSVCQALTQYVYTRMYYGSFGTCFYQCFFSYICAFTKHCSYNLNRCASGDLWLTTSKMFVPGVNSDGTGKY